MTEAEKLMVKECCDVEGADYAFICYSDFKGVKDKQFHKLLKEYRAARTALLDYCDVEY